MPKEWGPFNRELYPMFHSTVLPTILRNFDRLSMAHGIEIRMPFMDWRLVCYVMSLPDRSKFSNGQTKKVARDAMIGLMPEEIRSSKIKVGFNPPLPRWLAGPLKIWVSDLLEEQHHATAEIVNIPALRNFIRSGNSNTSWTWGEAHLAWQHINYIWFVDRFAKM